MTRPFRRFAGILAAVLLVGVIQGCGPSVVPLNTLPNTRSEAENLAYSVATNASCGSFEDLDPAGTQETWHFTARGAPPSTTSWCSEVITRGDLACSRFRMPAIPTLQRGTTAWLSPHPVTRKRRLLGHRHPSHCWIHSSKAWRTVGEVGSRLLTHAPGCALTRSACSFASWRPRYPP
jgi:hypothetical protein